MFEHSGARFWSEVESNIDCRLQFFCKAFLKPSQHFSELLPLGKHAQQDLHLTYLKFNLPKYGFF